MQIPSQNLQHRRLTVFNNHQQNKRLVQNLRKIKNPPEVKKVPEFVSGLPFMKHTQLSQRRSASLSIQHVGDDHQVIFLPTAVEDSTKMHKMKFRRPKRHQHQLSYTNLPRFVESKT